MRAPLTRQKLGEIMFMTASLYKLPMPPEWSRDGRAGRTYVRKFIKEHKDKIVIKRPKKLAGHRSMFCTEVCLYFGTCVPLTEPGWRQKIL